MLLKKITATVVFFTAALSLSAGEVTVKRLNYTIVLPENPSAACQLVGTELEHFLEKIYAKPIHFIGNTEPVTFYVGVAGEVFVLTPDIARRLHGR